MKRAIILVMDSFGIGATADADRFGDAGSNTLGSIARQRAAEGRPLNLPNLAKLGLFNAAEESAGEGTAGVDKTTDIIGTYGFAEEEAAEKQGRSGRSR